VLLLWVLAVIPVGTCLQESVLLGVVQGVFEWLPISSEGIVALLSQFFVGELNPIDLALFLHLGTIPAVLVYFRRDWLDVLTFKNTSLLRFLVITTMVSLAVGFPVYKTIRDIMVGHTLLFFMGFGLLSTSFLQKFSVKREIGSIGLAVIVGVLQGLAVIPGLSRSGATIFGLSLGRLSPPNVLKVSYMMSVPVVLAVSTYLWWGAPSLLLKSLPALVSSFLVGLAALHLLINFARRISFATFTCIFGFLCLFGAVTGLIIGI